METYIQAAFKEGLPSIASIYNVNHIYIYILYIYTYTHKMYNYTSLISPALSRARSLSLSLYISLLPFIADGTGKERGQTLISRLFNRQRLEGNHANHFAVYRMLTACWSATDIDDSNSCKCMFLFFLTTAPAGNVWRPVVSRLDNYIKVLQVFHHQYIPSALRWCN